MPSSNQSLPEPREVRVANGRIEPEPLRTAPETSPRALLSQGVTSGTLRARSSGSDVTPQPAAPAWREGVVAAAIWAPSLAVVVALLYLVYYWYRLYGS